MNFCGFVSRHHRNEKAFFAHVNITVTQPRSEKSSRKHVGFTLVETLVALIIMVIMMAAIGEVFHLAGSTVRLGQATLNSMSSVRVVEAQIAHDFRHFDTNEFLVIRQRYYAPEWLPGVQYTPGDEVLYNNNFYLCIHAGTTPVSAASTSTTSSGPGGPGTSGSGENPSTLPLMWQELYIPPMANTGGPGGGPGGSVGSSSGWTAGQYPVWRIDQLTFVADGHFQGRTGSYSGSGSSATLSMSDYLTADKAQIWYGQLTASYGPAAANNGNPELPYWPENSWNPTPMPSGSPAAVPSGETAGQYFFGRECILMIPQGSPTWGAGVYSNLNGNNGIWTAPDGETFDQTSSAIDAAYDVGLQGGGPGGGGSSGPQPTLASYLASLYDNQGNINVPIADPLCNRYGTVATPYDSTHGVLNGCIRMAPIMLRGVPSFSVDWTDGSTVPGSNPPQLEWWGLDNSGLPSSYSADLLPGDDGCPETWVFYKQNRADWPKALKITYLVTDRHNRMQGGHFVTQIIYLPH
jgi:type II secretory pathway pseudopilin PulG